MVVAVAIKMPGVPVMTSGWESWWIGFRYSEAARLGQIAETGSWPALTTAVSDDAGSSPVTGQQLMSS